MNTKHTPGPWKVAKSKMAAGTLIITAKDVDDTQCEVGMVSYHPGGRDWEAVSAANARLIAAAPELARSLERCEFLLRRISEGDGGGREGGGIHRAVQNSLDAADEARDVLLAARSALNADHITDQLRRILETAGLEIRHETHPSSMRVEFRTLPPLTWSFEQCDQATADIYNATISGKRLGDVFSTNHDRTHGYWDFRLESYDLDPDLAPHEGRTLCHPPRT